MHWNTLVPDFENLPAEISATSAMPLVPTMDIVRAEYLVNILARQGKHVMLVGDHGSAKSLVAQHYLSRRNAEGHLSKTIVFSSATTSNTFQVCFVLVQQYMGCTGVVELSTKSRRHVDGIFDVNKERAKIRKSAKSYAKFIRRPCTRQPAM